MASMIRTLDLRALDGDRPDHAARAYAAGWRIDEDYWWVRAWREGDPSACPEGFIERRHVFVVSAHDALKFDDRRNVAPAVPMITAGAVEGLPRIAVDNVFVPAGTLSADRDDDDQDGAA